jgi:hypothetical protein
LVVLLVVTLAVLSVVWLVELLEKTKYI